MASASCKDTKSLTPSVASHPFCVFLVRLCFLVYEQVVAAGFRWLVFGVTTVVVGLVLVLWSDQPLVSVFSSIGILAAFGGFLRERQQSNEHTVGDRCLDEECVLKLEQGCPRLYEKLSKSPAMRMKGMKTEKLQL